MRDPITPPYKIGYGFGYRGDIGVEGASKYHEGIDIAVPVGTPVYAPLAGEVVQVTTTGGAGYSIVLQHDATTRTRDNHLSRIPKYKRGDRVAEGEQIATSGGKVGAPGAGTSGGPHLHFAVYKLTRGEWTAIDPVPWLAAGHAAGGGGTDFTPEEEEMTPDQDARLKRIEAYLFKGGEEVDSGAGSRNAVFGRVVNLERQLTGADKTFTDTNAIRRLIRLEESLDALAAAVAALKP